LADGNVNEKLQETRECCVKAMSLWRILTISVTLKVHASEDHCIDQIKLYSGIGDYDEEFIERLHQLGKKDDVRTKSMRD
jgi:hypothetical protein